MAQISKQALLQSLSSKSEKQNTSTFHLKVISVLKSMRNLKSEPRAGNQKLILN